MSIKNKIFIIFTILTCSFCLRLLLFSKNFLTDKRRPDDVRRGFVVSQINQQMKSTGLENHSFYREESLGKIPLSFIPNEGQVDKQVDFYAKTSNFTLWLTKSGLIFDRVIHKEEMDSKTFFHGLDTDSQDVYERDVSCLEFLDSNINPTIKGYGDQEHKVNYFTGNTPSKWIVDIKTFKGVLYKNVYENIDLKVYGVGNHVEFDWIIKPGGDSKNIKFKYQNVKNTNIDDKGNIVINTQFGKMVHKKPFSYQVLKEKISVQSNYRKINSNTYTLEVDDYDKRYTLIIDPIVYVFSSFFGERSGPHGYSIGVDREKNIYLTGVVANNDFPIVNPFQSRFSGGTLNVADVFLSKISSDGKTIIYSTYFGGTAGEYAKSIVVDGTGCPYIAGYTYSWNLPVMNAFQPVNGGYKGSYDAFLVKFSKDGQSLVYSTYLGGKDQDLGYGIAVDSLGSAYVVGRTLSTDFPVYKALTSKLAGNGDGFLAKFSANGQFLLYSTYIGGSKWDEVMEVDVDTLGCAYVTGFTVSKDFPLKNAVLDKFSGACDVFVTKLSTSGTDIVYSTYLGGSDNDRGNDIKVNNNGEAIVAGITYSEDFILQNAMQSSFGGSADAFVSKISANGRNLKVSSFWGGTDWEAAYGLALRNADSFYITGLTFSDDFPIVNSDQGDYNQGNNDRSGDAFLTAFSYDQALCSTYIGGSNYDCFSDVAGDMNDGCYMIGYTWSGGSHDFPIQNALQPASLCAEDTVFLKLDMRNFQLAASTTQSDNHYNHQMNSMEFSTNSNNNNSENYLFDYDPSWLNWPVYRQFRYNHPTEYYNHLIMSNSSAVGDIDGDNDVDIVLSAFTARGSNHGSGDFPANEIVILINHEGIFHDETDKRLLCLNHYGNLGHFKLADVDRDDDLDLLVGASLVEYYSIDYFHGEQDRLFINNGNGYFSDETLDRLPEDHDGCCDFIELGDINNDGNIDVVIGSSSRATILINNGKGIFSIDTRSELEDMTSAALGDMNNDGSLDLIAPNSTLIDIYINDGSGKFSLHDSISNSGCHASQLIVADFNNDRMNDIFVVNGDEYEPEGLFINKGNLLFSEANAKLHQGTPPQYSYGAAVGDINNDGDIDIFLAVMSHDKNDLSRFYENQGNGVFMNSSHKIPNNSHSSQISLADFNGDSYMDFFLNDGMRSKLFNFITPVQPPTNANVKQVLNQSLFQTEYINILSWTAHLDNSAHEITSYRIYQLDGNVLNILAELNAGTFEYWHRNVSKTTPNTYALTAVTATGRESKPVYVSVK